MTKVDTPVKMIFKITVYRIFDVGLFFVFFLEQSTHVRRNRVCRLSDAGRLHLVFDVAKGKDCKSVQSINAIDLARMKADQVKKLIISQF